MAISAINNYADEWAGILGGGKGLATGGLGTALVGALTAGAIGAGMAGTAKPNIGGTTPNNPAIEFPAVDVPAVDTPAVDTPAVDVPAEGNKAPTRGKPPRTDTPPEIEDKTSENVETAIDNTDMLEMLIGLRDEQWKREDEIRNAVWAREDSAYSRAISDLRRSGVNVNLTGAQPAASGGGITNATGVDLGMLETALNNEGQTLIAMLNNEFKGDEATKDRIMQGITSAISLTGQIIMAYIFKGKK